MNRSISQSYTYTVTFKKDAFGEKKDQSYLLFDDNSVYDPEMMIFRQAPEDIAMLIRKFHIFPGLFKAIKNPHYHKHIYVAKTVQVCECGDQK